MNSEYEGIVQRATEHLRETVVADTQVGEEGCEYFAKEVLKAAGVEEALQAAESENERLREALEEILDLAERWHAPEDQRLSRVRIKAREALSDTADEVEGKS